MSLQESTNSHELALNRINAIDPDEGDTVVICGSRSMPFTSLPDKCIKEVQMAVAMSGFTVGSVVCGGADGADKAGAAFAQVEGLELVFEEPKLDSNGRPEFHKRNSRMVLQADHVIAIWDGASNGTADTIGKAREHLGDENVYVHPLGDVDVDATDVEPQEIRTEFLDMEG